MRSWLAARRALGIRTVIATFAGLGEHHDDWNGRKDDFPHLLQLLRLAAEVGLEREERILVTRDSLPDLAALLSELERLPGRPVKRVATLLMYRGKAEQLEDERPTADDLGCLPASVRELLETQTSWRTESQWTDLVTHENEGSETRLLHLRPDAGMIAGLEAKECDAIVDDLIARTRAAYAPLPSRRQLCAAVGDHTGQRVYAGFADLDRLWLDRYLACHPVAFDRSLTEFSSW